MPLEGFFCLSLCRRASCCFRLAGAQHCRPCSAGAVTGQTRRIPISRSYVDRRSDLVVDGRLGTRGGRPVVPLGVRRHQMGGCKLSILSCMEKCGTLKSVNPKVQSRDRSSGGKLFLAGFSLTLGNPKIMLFYMALLPTIVDLKHLSVTGWIALVIVMLAVLATVYVSWLLAAAKARRLLKTPRAMRLANRCGAGMMAGASDGNRHALIENGSWPQRPDCPAVRTKLTSEAEGRGLLPEMGQNAGLLVATSKR